MRKLSVVEGLAFPIEAVTQKFAWIGRTGSGKTYGLKRFVEQMLYQEVQVVVLDTVGVWNGLRLGEKGFAIPVLGGLYGDIPLDAAAGALVAEVTVEHGSSLVLDTSKMTDGQRAKFCEAFGRRLFELKKSAPGAMHIVLDEGQDIVPQNPNEGEKMMLHEWVRISKQGRAFGIGTSISTQRPQEVNKKALNQVECVMAFQLTGPHERKALQYWMADRGVDTRLSEILPTLEVGEPFVWSPQWLKVSQRSRVLPIDSEDTSRTPTVGEKRAASGVMRPIDLSQLSARMDSMIRDAKQNDPKVLRARIQELESGGTQTVSAPCAEALMLLQVMLSESKMHGALGATTRLSEVLMQAQALQQEAVQLMGALSQKQQHWRQLTERLEQLNKLLTNKPTTSASPPREVVNPAGVPARNIKRVRLFDQLPSGAQEVMKAAYQYGELGAPTGAIHMMTGHASRTVTNYLTLLANHEAGALIERRGDRVVCTELGRACVPEGTVPFPTGMALVEHLRQVLQGSIFAVLKFIAGNHPEPVSIPRIAAHLGLSERTVTNYLTELSSIDVVVRSKGMARLSHLFEET